MKDAAPLTARCRRSQRPRRHWLIASPLRRRGRHHRILLYHISAARWANLTPDHDFAIHNFDEDDIVEMEQGQDFPDEVRYSCYAFDTIAPHVLSGFRRRAKLPAAFLGEATELQEPSATAWIYADSLDARLGETVASEAREVNGAFESIGGRGVVRIDGEVKFVKRALLADIPDFVQRRRSSTADWTTLGLHMDSTGRPYVDFRDAVSMMREEDRPHWTFGGPRAASEYPDAIVADSTYHAEPQRGLGGWRGLRRPPPPHGGAPGRGVRRPAPLEGAVPRRERLPSGDPARDSRRAQPRHPDFSGLVVVEGGVTTGRGNIRVPRCREHIATRQRERAAVLKSERVYREEHGKTGYGRYPAGRRRRRVREPVAVFRWRGARKGPRHQWPRQEVEGRRRAWRRSPGCVTA